METPEQHGGDAADIVVPMRRTGRGSLRGQIHIPDDFDELPDEIADAFGSARPSPGHRPM